MGLAGQTSTFSEHSHAAYEIKQNHECSNMVANILPTDIPTLGMGSVGLNSTFSEHGHVAYQIEGNQEMQQHGSKHFACRHLPDPITLTLLLRLRFQIQLLQNKGMLHIKINAIKKCSNMVANILPATPPPPPPDPPVHKVKIQLFQNNIMLHIKLKGITNAATR